MKTVVVSGASGYIGQSLVRALEPNGVDVRTIGRGGTSDATWSDEQGVADVLSGADLLVNLAGRSVSCRYNKRNADEIFSSRVETTALLGRALARTPQPPSLWANASTGTIYRDARIDRWTRRTENWVRDSPSLSRGRGARIVLSPNPRSQSRVTNVDRSRRRRRAINPFVNLARTGFGGRMGDGRQMFSWIHIADVVRSVIHIYEHPEISGPVNIASPYPVTNTDMMRMVRAKLGRQCGFPTPGWMLEFGARIIRTEAELVTKSRWVLPGVLADSGFQYQFPTLESALKQIAQETPRGLLPVTLG